MQYKIEVIKNLLNAVYESEFPFTTNIELLNIINNEFGSYQNEYADAYTKILSELNLMKSDADNFGFERFVSGELICKQTNVYLTYAGQEFIQKLNDKTIWNKIIKNGSSIGLGTLKVLAPCLLTQFVAGL